MVDERPQRIAFITETFAPEVNGVANTLAYLVRGLMSRRHALHVVRPRQAADGRRSEPPPHGETLVRGLPIPGYRALKMGVPRIGQMRRVLRAVAPDVIYVATPGPLGLAAVRSANRLGIPVVSGFHTNFHQYSRHYLPGIFAGAVFAYLRWLHGRTVATLVPSRLLKDALEGAGFRNVHVIGRGVDVKLFDPARRCAAVRDGWGLGPDERAILYVGRLAAEKNLQLAVRAFRAAQQHDPGLRFVLVGDGPQAAALQRAHPDFIYCGMRLGEDLAAHYASGDIMVFPSTTETFGNVVIEGLASGLPVVAFDYAAAAAHITPGVSGMLAPLGDEDAFIDQLSALADDPERARSQGREARRHATTVSWDAVVDAFAHVLRRAANGGPDDDTDTHRAVLSSH